MRDTVYRNGEHLTEDQGEAQDIWEATVRELKKCGRGDVLNKPFVLDLGGGAGEFAKNLNKQGIFCTSLDMKQIVYKEGAHQVRADAHKIPFSDESMSIVYSRGGLDRRVYTFDYAKLISEIARVLKTKGVFIHFIGDLPAHELEKYFTCLKKDEFNFPNIWEKK